MADITYRCSECGHFFLDSGALYRHACFQPHYQDASQVVFVPQSVGTSATSTVTTSNLTNRSCDVATAVADDEVTDGDHALPTLNNPISWSHEAILLLVRTYQEYKDLFKSPTVKKQEVWRKIAGKLNREGHTYSSIACDKKFRSLKYRYNSISDANNMSGRGKRAWGYLDLMGEVLEGDPAVTPVATLASMTPESTIQTTSVTPAKKEVIPKKKAKKNEIPDWFVEFAKKQETQLEDVKKIQLESLAVAKERNDILRAFTEALSRRNEV